MTKTKWSRDMYYDLEEYLKRKVPLGDLAEKMGVEKKELPYRIKILNEGKDYPTMWVEELHLLESTNNIDTFLTKFRGLYGKRRTIDAGIYHWNHKDKYIKKWKDETKAVHNVALQKKKIVDPILPQTPDVIVDEHDWNRKIYDALQELLRVQKDTYTLFKAIDERAVAAKQSKEVKNNV
jgi:hypothetical protein